MNKQHWRHSKKKKKKKKKKNIYIYIYICQTSVTNKENACNSVNGKLVFNYKTHNTKDLRFVNIFSSLLM